MGQGQNGRQTTKKSRQSSGSVETSTTSCGSYRQTGFVHVGCRMATSQAEAPLECRLFGVRVHTRVLVQ